MIKISLPNDCETWFQKEMGSFFKRTNNDYCQASRIIRSSLGVSFKKLLIMKPNELKELAVVLTREEPKNYASDKTKLIKMYTSFRSSISSKNFIEKVNIKVCPYCNRNYIFNFNKKKEKHATAQLDHFFDKDKYPYFALCLYNLVPCCSTCNQRKSKKDVLSEPILNPYEDNIHNHINFTGYNILSSLGLEQRGFFSEERIQVGIEKKTSDSRVKEHLGTFNIEALFNNHKDTVAELYQKRVMYPDSLIDELRRKYEGKVFSDKEELLRLITCGYVDDESLNKRPLSKLIKDISKELGFL